MIRSQNNNFQTLYNYSNIKVFPYILKKYCISHSNKNQIMGSFP